MRIVTSNFLLLISVPLNVGILESLIVVNALLTSLGSLPDDRNLIEERFEAPAKDWWYICSHSRGKKECSFEEYHMEWQEEHLS